MALSCEFFVNPLQFGVDEISIVTHVLSMTIVR